MNEKKHLENPTNIKTATHREMGIEPVTDRVTQLLLDVLELFVPEARGQSKLATSHCMPDKAMPNLTIRRSKRAYYRLSDKRKDSMCS